MFYFSTLKADILRRRVIIIRCCDSWKIRFDDAVLFVVVTAVRGM